MKERPILFSGEMVRAILERRKTQTRRVVTVPWHKGKRVRPYEPWYVESDKRLLYQDEYGDYHPMERRCPFGQPGDRLWVRETWQLHETNPNGLTVSRYKVMDSPNYWMVPSNEILKTMGYPDADTRWRPSIFMPRWASRVTLEITGVRVERVQDISDTDVLAEGTSVPLVLRGGARYVGLDYETDGPSTPVEYFRRLWDSINAKRGCGWDVNPWVWVIEFKVVQP